MTIQTKQANKTNYGGRRADTRYIVVHYTSNRGDTAKNNADYFAREDVGASAHYFVDENEIWASVPEDCAAWHCGAKKYRHPACRNANSIGVEICMNDKAGAVRQGSIDRAAQLVRMLIDKYHIPKENVLRHYDVTGKHCPGPMVDDSTLWESFKKSLAQGEDERMKTYTHTDQMPDWAQDTFHRLIAAEIVKVDKAGEIEVYEPSVQPMVYIDRLCNGQIEKLPEAIKALQVSNK